MSHHHCVCVCSPPSGLHPGPHNLSCVSYKHPSVRGGLGGTGGGQGWYRPLPPRPVLHRHLEPEPRAGAGLLGGRGGPPAPLPPAPPVPRAPPVAPSSSASATVTSATATPGGTGTALGLGGPHHGPAPSPGGSAGTLWLWGAGSLLLLLLTCLAGFGLQRARTPTRRQPQGCRGIGVPLEPPSTDLPALRFLQVLQTGRFSAVWRGTLQQRPVAIKAFAAGAAGRFAAERAVHGLPLMEHDNVARLLGTGGAGPQARGGLLVLQLYPRGSLRHFLGQHVGTWATSVRLALSLARGLAFLHQELWRDARTCWCGRTGPCAIGDFGLALALPPRAQAGTSARHSVAIRKAGTQRYLAPEILDESLDLRALGPRAAAGRRLRPGPAPLGDPLALPGPQPRSARAGVSAGVRGRAGCQPHGCPAPAFGRGRTAAAADPPRLAPAPPRSAPPPTPTPLGTHGSGGAPAGAAGGLLGPRPRGAALGRAGAPAAATPGCCPPPRPLPGGPLLGCWGAPAHPLCPPPPGPGAVTCHVGRWCSHPPQPRVPPKPHVPPQPPPPNPAYPLSPRTLPRGTPKPTGGAWAAPVPPGPPPYPQGLPWPRGPPCAQWDPRGAPPCSPPPRGVPPVPPGLDKKAAKKMKKRMKKAHKRHKRSSSSSSSSSSDSD
ncbi:unnamed protein product [Bubo scandiacus]